MKMNENIEWKWKSFCSTMFRDFDNTTNYKFNTILNILQMLKSNFGH